MAVRERSNGVGKQLICGGKHGISRATSGAVIDERVGNIDLLSGIVDDTRELVSANVEILRTEMSSKLSVLGSTLSSSLIAIAVFIVTAILLCLAVAASLIAVGLPAWASLWAVTLIAGAIGYSFVRRAQTASRSLTTGDKS